MSEPVDILIRYDPQADRIVIKTIPDANSPDLLFDILHGAMMQIRKQELAQVQHLVDDQRRPQRSEDDPGSQSNHAAGQEPGAGVSTLADNEQQQQADEQQDETIGIHA
jgi:hypothetical protein